jgi:hypothetical protein
MRRRGDHGRILWLALVVLVAAFVLADFVRSPLFPGSGAGAIAAPKLTLWVPAPEASGPAGQVAASAAAGLDLAGHPTVVKRLRGGTSAALVTLLSRPSRQADDLLVLSSSTLAGIARDETDRIVPGAAGRALEASALLRRAPVAGLLSRERLELAASAGSGIRSGAELVSTIRAAPEAAVFAIPDDTWSHDELASLVDRVGRGGTVPFVSYEDDDLAARARADGLTNVMLASRGEIAAEARSGHLRPLAWPAAAGRPPRSWVVAIAPATYSRARLAELRDWVGTLIAEPRWRHHQRKRFRSPGRRWSPGLAATMRREIARSRRRAATDQAIARLQG